MTPNEPTDSERRLREFLRPLRRPRGEGQWTQMIASIARADPVFAGRLASVLVAAAPRASARDQLGPVPERVICTPEYSLTGTGGPGRVDLRFTDEGGEGEHRFELFAELKLGASYGWQQLERYIAALDASCVPASALVAITTVTEQFGEETVTNDPRWLGSIRWSDVFHELRELDHVDPLLAGAWRASLDLLREQGDFGPMDLDETAVKAWARRDDAETILRYLLGEMAQPRSRICARRSAPRPTIRPPPT